MRSKDKVLFIGVALVAAIISLVVAGSLFNSPAKRNSKAPVVETINPTFPDVKNDPNYSGFLNTNALDPALPVSVGSSQNTSPFR